MELREIKTGLLTKFLNELLLKYLGRQPLISLLRIVDQLLILLNDRPASLEQLGQQSSGLFHLCPLDSPTGWR